MTPSCRRCSDESGFSLVEVMIAIVVLSLGVLGSMALVDTANRKTASTKAREGGINLARDLVESARTVPFNNLTQSELQAALASRTGLADSDGQAGWQVVRRDFAYTVQYTVCTVDDASDRLAAAHPAGFCPGTQAAPSASGADRNPVDFMRVVFTVSWQDGGARRQVQQSGLVNSTYRGPAVKALGGPTSIFTGTAADFTATLDSRAASVKWYVNGRLTSEAEGSGTSWSWKWDLGTPCAGGADSVQDGSYFVSAVAYDPNGSTGGPKAAPVTINRCVPAAPTGLEVGRSWNGVEVTWAANPEQDVLGYSVFRDGALVCSTNSASATTCRDESAPPSGTHLYRVVAYDTGPSGRRAGEQSAAATLLPECGSAPCNTAPNAPTVSVDGATLTIVPGNPADPDDGDTVKQYRIYRTKSATPPTSAGDRYDVVDAGSEATTWTDPSPDSFHYWVTAVDGHHAESGFAEVAP